MHIACKKCIRSDATIDAPVMLGLSIMLTLALPRQGYVGAVRQQGRLMCRRRLRPACIPPEQLSRRAHGARRPVTKAPQSRCNAPLNIFAPSAS